MKLFKRGDTRPSNLIKLVAALMNRIAADPKAVEVQCDQCGKHRDNKRHGTMQIHILDDMVPRKRHQIFTKHDARTAREKYVYVFDGDEIHELSKEDLKYLEPAFNRLRKAKTEQLARRQDAEREKLRRGAIAALIRSV